MSEHVEAGPGLWLPRRAREKRYQVFAGKPAKLYLDARITMEHWLVNSELVETTWEYRFPAGTVVQDEVTGKRYVVPGVGGR